MKRLLPTACFLWAISCCCSGGDAFTLASSRPRRSTICPSVRHAKSPLKSGFDLKAIEAFELQLDQQQEGESVGEPDERRPSFLGNDDSILRLTVPEELSGRRIDAVLATLLADRQLSRSVCGTLVVQGRVRTEEGALLDRKSIQVAAGTVLEVTLPEGEPPTEIVPQGDLPLEILFEDQHLIVLNKAAHMVVHPAVGNWNGTVVNALAHYLPRSRFGRGDFLDERGKPTGLVVTDPQLLLLEEDDDDEEEEDPSVDNMIQGESNTASFRPGIVHRLDKGTTGVLVVAKTSRALAALSSAFANRQVSKTYLAITVGNPGNNVKIDKPIGRHPIHRQRMRVVPDPHQKNSRNRLVAPRATISSSRGGKRALSYVDTLAFDGKLGLVRVKIETGRTHQIRVHLQDRHTPIYGDDVYGLSDWNKRLTNVHQISRPLLHAYKLSISHPITGELMKFTAPLDKDMMSIARAIVPPGSEQDLETLLNWD